MMNGNVNSSDGMKLIRYVTNSTEQNPLSRVSPEILWDTKVH